MKTLTKFIAASLVGCALHSSPALACTSEPLIGQVCPVAFNFAPRGWALTNGQLLSVSSNSALFSILGTTYGGDGRTTFGLPDTRGRVVIGAGQGPGLSDYRLGTKGGVDSVTLTANQIGAHSHGASTSVSATTTITVAAQINASSNGANQSSPAGNVLAVAPSAENMYRAFANNVPQVTMHPGSISFSLPTPLNLSATGNTSVGNFNGGNGAHENRMPVQSIHWVIALTGVFPSRT